MTMLLLKVLGKYLLLLKKVACLLQTLMMKFVAMKSITRKLIQVKPSPVFNATLSIFLPTM
jgi:hypothetical protein